MVNKDRITKDFIELASIDSLTRKERQMADALKQKLQAMGFEVEEDQAGEKIGGTAGNLICTIKGNKDVPAVMLAAHMDTVDPGIGKKPIVEDGVIKSDGTTVLGSDDVAGIVCILESLRVLNEKSLEHGDIQVVFSIAEEGGLLGARNLDYSRIYAKHAIVLDSGGPIGTVAVKAPSHNIITATVKGLASHAGVSPEKGISAIQIASVAIAAMKLGRIDSETTANIGSIKGGGQTNIICDKVEINAEARSLDNQKLDEQTAHMKDCFEKAAAKFGGKVDFKAVLEYSSFSMSKDAKIMSILKKAAEDANIKLLPEETGGGSDTSIFNENGIEAVNISAGMKQVHSVDENILIDDMALAVKFLLSIIQNIS